MRAFLFLVCLCACDAVPPLVFDEGGSDASTTSEGGCPDTVPSFATKCCGTIPCFGMTCCDMCESKCPGADLCCVTMGNVVCRKNMTTCP